MKLKVKFLGILVALLIPTGCNYSSNTSTNNSETPTVISDQQPQPVSNPDPTNMKTKTQTGRYNGQIDTNSIEINISKIPDQTVPEVYRLSESIKASFDSLKLSSGDTIEVTYKLNKFGQNVVEKITILNRTSKIPPPPSNPNPPQTKIDTGRYVGQIDNNSIEILISGVPNKAAAKAFKLSESIKANFHTYALQKDDQIKITFIPQNEGQPIITKIEKLKM